MFTRSVTPLRCMLFLGITGLYIFITLYVMHVRDCPAPYAGSFDGMPKNPEVLGVQDNLDKEDRANDDLIKNENDHLRSTLASKLRGPTAPTIPTGQPQAVEQAALYHSEADLLDHHELLNPDFAPNTIHMVWCGKRWFEFHHYIGLKSLIKELHPDEINIFYETYPVLDFWLYNNWLEELKTEYPFLRTIQINPKNAGPGCTSHGKADRKYILHLLTYYGGIYLNEHTTFTKFPFKLRSYDLIDGLDPVTGHGFMMAKANMPIDTQLEKIKRDRSYKTKIIKCVNKEEFNALVKLNTEAPMCVVVRHVYYPKDIWDTKTSWAGLVRRVFYGSPSVPVPRQSYDTLIPNIAHVIWLGGGQMDYLFYLCVLSLLFVQEVDVLYLHGDAPPTGPYWEKVKHYPKIKLIHRYQSMQVYGTDVNVLSHVTDIWRVDFMIKYGGIYVDTDVVWVQKLDREMRSYDAVGSYDWTDWNSPFPDTINFGVAIGKRNASYWHHFQKTMNWFIDKDWSWNGLRQPYRVKERRPELVKIDPRLQVICYKYQCRPTWWPNYHNESIHHLNSASIKDWKKDAYAIHMTLPTPPELYSEEANMESDTMFADIGRYVLKKAGLYKPFDHI